MSDVVEFYINDTAVTASAEDSDMSLVDFLHEDQHLTGTKFCCGIGVCRACTVGIKNEKSAPLETTLSCSTPVSAVNGLRIYTVESLGTAENLAPLQEAFLEHFSFQCGYCTPGFLMAATALIERLEKSPVSETELDKMIHTWVGSNLCRCTGYVRYLDAIKKVALATLAKNNLASRDLLDESSLSDSKADAS